ncbi:MAG: hypothetical protein ACRYHQ_00635 [Janthinobacterium lividum]
MTTRSGLTLALIFAASLAPVGAGAQQAPRRGTFYIAPGNPNTVGQGGAVVGVVPHQIVPAPQGSMATFGGLLGTGAPRAVTAPNAAAPAPGSTTPR